MTTNEEQDTTTVESSGLGCGVAILGICLFLVLINTHFWEGLRSVVEAGVR